MVNKKISIALQHHQLRTVCPCLYIKYFIRCTSICDLIPFRRCVLMWLAQRNVFGGRFMHIWFYFWWNEREVYEHRLFKIGNDNWLFGWFMQISTRHKIIQNHNFTFYESDLVKELTQTTWMPLNGTAEWVFSFFFFEKVKSSKERK